MLYSRKIKGGKYYWLIILLCYFDSDISMDETFEVRPSSLVIDSVPMRISLIFASWTNRFLVISAASTALLIARPRALMTTSVDPLLNWVTTART